MSGTFGARLRSARKAIDMSGPSLAKALGVSAQTVSEWERDKYFPEADKVGRIATLLHVKVDWLIIGRDEPTLGRVTGGGRLVSKVAFGDLAGFDPHDLAQHTQRDKVFSHFPCSQHAFQITIADASNATEFLPGDSVIIDPALTPEPGNMVLIVADGVPLFRRLRPRGGLLELVPLNTDWEAQSVKLGRTVRMLGAMSEHSRQRR